MPSAVGPRPTAYRTAKFANEVRFLTLGARWWRRCFARRGRGYGKLIDEFVVAMGSEMLAERILSGDPTRLQPHSQFNRTVRFAVKSA